MLARSPYAIPEQNSNMLDRAMQQEAPNAALSATPSKFDVLLKQLAEEHYREIQELTEGNNHRDDGGQPSPPPHPLHWSPPRPPEENSEYAVDRSSTIFSELANSIEPSLTTRSIVKVKHNSFTPNPPEENSELAFEQTPTMFSERNRSVRRVKLNSLVGHVRSTEVERSSQLTSSGHHESQALRAVWVNPPQSALSQQERSSECATHSIDEFQVVDVLPGKIWYISYPNSKWRLLWDLLGMVFIAIDFVMIPFSVFEPPETVGMRIVAWVILLFWSADVVATFFVGYVSKGQIIVEPRRIAHNYLHSWFVVDLLVVIPDWVSTLVLSSGDSKPGGATRLIRILRIARILRLLRLMKLGRILATVEDRIDSEYVFVVMEILKLIVLVVMISHVLACGFYAIGTFHDGPDTWNTALEGTSLDYKYFTSLHWSLSKVALESMDLEAMNTRERVFTNLILILGLFASSSVVSRITMSMLQLQELGKEQAKQFWLLRRYLVERGVPSALGTRIQRFLEHEVERQQYFVPEGNVKLLGLLSRHLSGELQSFIAMTVLGAHLYIQKLSETSDVTVFRICVHAITRSQCARGDALFLEGEEALNMYFVVTGVVMYNQKHTASSAATIRDTLQDNAASRIEKSGYLCEPAIWCTWTHRGVAALETQSELLELDAIAFANVVQHHPVVHAKAQEYANQFGRALRQLPTQEYSDMIDCISLGLGSYLIATFDGGARYRLTKAARNLGASQTLEWFRNDVSRTTTLSRLPTVSLDQEKESDS